MGETITVMPFSDLECLIGFIDESKHHFIQYGTYPTEEEAEHFGRYKAFLEGIKTLYVECAGCKKMIAPDENRNVSVPLPPLDNASDDVYCTKCHNEEN